jgi:hypothetical protein
MYSDVFFFVSFPYETSLHEMFLFVHSRFTLNTVAAPTGVDGQASE